MIQDTVKIAAIQMNCIANNKEANIKKAITLIEKAAKEGSNILVLPELFTTGYYSYREFNQRLFD